jgi:hypothetical protein
MMLGGRVIFKKWGWGTAALVTPITILITGIAFFSLTLFPAFFAPITAKLGTTPLMLAVMIGAAQVGVMCLKPNSNTVFLTYFHTVFLTYFLKPNSNCVFYRTHRTSSPREPSTRSSTPARRWPTSPSTQVGVCVYVHMTYKTQLKYCLFDFYFHTTYVSFMSFMSFMSFILCIQQSPRPKERPPLM